MADRSRGVSYDSFGEDKRGTIGDTPEEIGAHISARLKYVVQVAPAADSHSIACVG